MDLLKVTQWVSNTAVEGVKSQNLVPCLLEDNDLCINWVFALFSVCVTGRTCWEFMTVKQTIRYHTTFCDPAIWYLFALFIIVMSTCTTEKARCKTPIHKTVPDEETLEQDLQEQGIKEMWHWTFDKHPSEFNIPLQFFSLWANLGMNS